MKILKKLLFLLPMLLFIFCVGCKKESGVKVGIMQIVEHESLDSARQGFIDELKSSGYENSEFDLQIAGGDLSNCASIAEKFVNDRKNIVLSISTPCAQAMANATKDIPILATAITDFEGAEIIESNKRPGTNITGTSDLAPIDKIISLVKQLNPEAKKVGILYSTTDPSPQYQAKLAEEKAKELGLETKTFTVSQTHEVQQVAEKLAKEVDALYVPIDKVTFSAMPQISQVFLNQGKFVVCAEETMISKGAIATYGVNYYELGKMTARQAVKILNGEATPETMPVEYLSDPQLYINHEITEKLGIEIPKELEEKSK